jgi:sulfur relay (sulfurtransferase) complex TusBCD TusD component (DsrE family)
MKLPTLTTALLALALAMPLSSPPARASDPDPLFVNLTTDDAHRARMAFAFSQNQAQRKHPVAIFLNDRGVRVGSKAHSRKYKAQQAQLMALIKDGATVLVCPMCMQHYGVKEKDLLEGLKVGNPDLVGGALFRDRTKTLTW